MSPAPDARGPLFRFVDEVPADAGIPRKLRTPLLVKGAIRSWKACERWTFGALAGLRRRDGSDVRLRFQDGLVEQGRTRPLPVLPFAPFLRELEAEADRSVPPDRGLLSDDRRRGLAPGEPFRLDWDFLRHHARSWKYLADWPVLEEFPELREDFDLRLLWPGPRWTWQYVFLGPALTVTGLHLDIHNNWFCQIRGTKELVLLPPGQVPEAFISRKYNLGSVLTTIDILRLHERPQEAEAFSAVEGALYVRAEAGDALYVPKGTWHAVVAREPSISLGVFGLTAAEILTEGAWAEFKNLLHLARLYRWRNCICHGAGGA